MKSSEIRKAFIDYFANKNHQVVPSSSLVPGQDPTLLFTNAGMVQFKDIFLGLEAVPYTRAVSSQCCVRAGGKHNDLDNVGYTARHHTFFEMLGNFSFGDYFKREAINYAWEFLTKVLRLPPEKLWVTVYEKDDEAAEIWLKEVGVSSERFSRCGDKDNFWSMGDTGPCGPCTEIFYDHGPEIAGGPPGTPEAEGDRYIEIWNLVFMQFNRDKEGKLHPLPKPSVDTGMGLERISAVVQGVHNNYEIDSFRYLIAAIANLIHAKDHSNPSFKVIADHIRACSFLISDGVTPSNEGRGYVLRRIIRRAVRHGNKLNMPTPFFYKLVKPLVEIMAEAYPVLKTNQAHIEKVLLLEEEQFSKTLDQGLKILQDYIKTLKNKVITGEMAFKLYDTYGFPVDLTADIVREQDLSLDMEGFSQCMDKQRQQSQLSSQFNVDYSNTKVNSNIKTHFSGYEGDISETTVVQILQNDQEAQHLAPRQSGAIILQETPFYAESGGQVGDKGFIKSENAIFRVDDTQKIGQAILHYGEMLQGTIALKQKVSAEIDAKRRNAIRLNHTATHLLHAALKKVLGSHVQQKGSLVDAERARFDFSHHESVTTVQLQEIENLVNEKIRNNELVNIQEMAIDEAKASGAVALFGEKYAEQVRVLSIGEFSKELCGGTHVNRTGDIGLFKIIAEYGIASGVRRIEIMTGEYALQWVQEQIKTNQNISQLLKSNPQEIEAKLAQVLQDVRQNEKELISLKQKLASQSGNSLLSEMKQVGKVNLLVKQFDQMNPQDLRTLLDQLKSKCENAVIVLVNVNADKMNVLVGISSTLIGKVPNAGEIVKYLCGKGGGRPDMAQGGGPVPDDLQEKLGAIAGQLENN